MAPKALPSLAVVLVLSAWVGGNAWAADMVPTEALCAAHTETYNRDAGFPPHMLTAISLVESGRWSPTLRARVAWPWTVTSGGDGNFYPSKAEALAAVQALQARGVRNIDVGCMQVNLHFHGEAFDNVDEALDPAANVAYAVSFLRRLYAETNSWAASVTAYHSRTPEYAERYAGKINQAWTEAEATAPARLVLASQVTPGRFTGNDAPQQVSQVSPPRPSSLLERYRVAGAARAEAFLAQSQAIAAQANAKRAAAQARKTQEDAERRAAAEAWRAEKLKAWQERRIGAPPS
ncbi:transglycosylase SLT domain-containing protein [Pararhodospirillum photometricum]|nr:transglycosylase SLT domain-containing protein [Pararhodospirillum photometricum]